EIVAGTEFRIIGRERVAGAVIDEVGVGIERRRLPDARATDAPGIVLVLPGLRAGLARRRNREGAPYERTGVGVERASPAPGAHRAASAFADQHQLLAAAGLDGQRRAREALHFRWRSSRGIGRRGGIDLPDHLA